MTWPAVWAAALAMTAAPGTNPDPKSLAVPPADRAKAESLVKLLASPAFRDRDRATRELTDMGRLALTAVQAGLTATDTEVRAKCEWLYPQALAAEHRARTAAFLADVDGKFNHDLPGWNELRTASGNTPAARKLYVELIDHKANAALVAAFGDPVKLPILSATRRMEIYTRMYGMAPDRTRVLPTVPDVAGLMLAEILTKGSSVDRRYNFATTNVLVNPGPVRDAVNGSGEATEAFRKLIARWMMTRTDPADVYSVMSVAANLNLKDAPASALAEKLLAASATTPTVYRMYALAALARTEDKKYLPVLRKSFTDSAAQAYRRPNQQVSIQVGDAALAFTLTMLGKKPEDYGFDPIAGVGTSQRYFWYTNAFASEEKRKFGFMKFAWEEARAKAALKK